ncbi:MAG: aminotransferase class I/II-fold pyridoxal phosphate-dependent enzyme [Gammaproteobacteria bacterium]|nr:aminotransferase class I/II-fold pyridoxal phosphate-dependent enzyme [Gammaproteobacteria bacterium]
MSRISHRIGSISESKTLAVSAKARALREAGHDVIGFGAGEPDFPTPSYIVEAAAEACATPKYHKYSPAAGLPELREAVADKTNRDAGFPVTAGQVLITNGAKHAVFAAMATLLDPGDEVLLPSPYWVTYPEAIKLAGGITVPITADIESGFRVDIDSLEAAWTPKTKILLFVSPSNPSGAVYPPEEVEAIGRWAAEKGIWVVTDDIYEHLVYGDAEYRSMPGAVPDLRDRAVTINGTAKAYAMTGWRVGWMVGPPDVIAAASNLQSHSTSNVCNIAQAAALAALRGGLEPVTSMREAFDRRRRTMYRMLRDIPGIRIREPEGAFYAFPSLEAFLNRPVGGKVSATTAELAEVVLEEALVAFVPGEAFGAPGYGRFSYALGDEELEEGLRRLADLLIG